MSKHVNRSDLSFFTCTDERLRGGWELIEAGGKKSTGASFLNKSENSSYITVSTFMLDNHGSKSKKKSFHQGCSKHNAELQFKFDLRKIEMYVH